MTHTDCWEEGGYLYSRFSICDHVLNDTIGRVSLDELSRWTIEAGNRLRDLEGAGWEMVEPLNEGGRTVIRRPVAGKGLCLRCPQPQAENSFYCKEHQPGSERPSRRREES